MARVEIENGPVCSFRAERKHMNAVGVMHGGCLMTFADYSLFAIAHEHLNLNNETEAELHLSQGGPLFPRSERRAKAKRIGQ